MPEALIATQVRPDAVGVITLHRPDRLNAISSGLADALLHAVSVLGADPDVRSLVVAGEGRVFCAGADIAEFAALEAPRDFESFLSKLAAALEALATSAKPSIAALHGVALGGGLELALACDIRVAEEGTRLGMPEIKLGLLPGATGTARLPRQLPVPVARQMLLTGEAISASEARAYGLVAEVCPAGAALDTALALAARLAALPPLALGAAKRLVAQGPGLPLDAAVQLERQTVAMLFGTADRIEGVNAFLDKRSPTFRGN